LKERVAKAPPPEHFELAGASDLNDDALLSPLEESFYVIDIGVLVSQVYQWRMAFPRVEPFYAVKVCNVVNVLI
jgi:diaminopimelate decarboxylase